MISCWVTEVCKSLFFLYKASLIEPPNFELLPPLIKSWPAKFRKLVVGPPTVILMCCPAIGDLLKLLLVDGIVDPFVRVDELRFMAVWNC